MVETTAKTMISIYNDNVKQLEGLKRDLYLWAIHGQFQKVEELKDAIIKYEADIRKFEQQMVKYNPV
jgi:hypothetical protein